MTQTSNGGAAIGTQPWIPKSQFRTTTREFAPGIHWLCYCKNAPPLKNGQAVHDFNGAYLLIGASRTVLVDSRRQLWSQLSADLDRLLGDRPLDFIAPTHPEAAHAGCTGLLLDRYPGARVVGDVKDYHVHFPKHEHRLMPKGPGSRLDLGGGMELVFLPAPIKDLPSSQWFYEAREKVLFVGDGFGYVHMGEPSPEHDSPVHLPGQCSLLSAELFTPINVEMCGHVTRSALIWSALIDTGPLLAEVDAIMEQYPPRFIAPAHGNVISNPSEVYPVIRESLGGGIR